MASQLSEKNQHLSWWPFTMAPILHLFLVPLLTWLQLHSRPDVWNVPSMHLWCDLCTCISTLSPCLSWLPVSVACSLPSFGSFLKGLSPRVCIRGHSFPTCLSSHLFIFLHDMNCHLTYYILIFLGHRLANFSIKARW